MTDRLAMTSLVKRNEILVFEKQPWWTPELQRQFNETGLPIRMATSRTRLLEMLAAAESPLIVMVFDDAPADCLQTLSVLKAKAQTVPIVVLASIESAELECPVRELGADGFVARHVTGDELASICRRMGVPG